MMAAVVAKLEEAAQLLTIADEAVLASQVGELADLVDVVAGRAPTSASGGALQMRLFLTATKRSFLSWLDQFSCQPLLQFGGKSQSVPTRVAKRASSQFGE